MALLNSDVCSNRNWEFSIQLNFDTVNEAVALCSVIVADVAYQFFPTQGNPKNKDIFSLGYTYLYFTKGR